MRGVRLVAQRVQKKDIERAQQIERRFRDVAVVREIRRGAEAETVNRLAAMQNRNRQKLQAEQIEGRAIDEARIEPRTLDSFFPSSKMYGKLRRMAAMVSVERKSESGLPAGN